MAIQSNLAGVARVAFEAVTGEFNRDVDVAERNYKQATSGMSDGAIKLELAQERLRRSLAKGPAASREQARSLLSLRQAERDLAQETSRSTVAIDRQDRALRGLGRGSGLSGLRSRVVGLTAAFVGSAGLLYGLRSVVEAAKESELVLGQTKLAVAAAGLEWERYRGQIEATIRAQSRLGFDDEKLLKTFSTFVVRTKDVSEALKLNALAADVARGRYIDLEAAAQIVLKASIGQSGALRRMGIDVAKGAKSYELLAKLTESYGGRAKGATDTATASTDRLGVSFENIREALGSGLTPAVASLSDEISGYLDDAGRQEEIQRRVNAAVETGTGIVKGLATSVRVLKNGLAPLVNALGGVEHAVQLAFVLGIVAKVRKAALSFGFIAAASQATTTKVVLDAGRAGAALDVAYRPRVLSVTSVGGGAGRGAGGLLGLAGGPIGLGVTAIAASYFINTDKRAQEKAKWDALTARQQRVLLERQGMTVEEFTEVFGWKVKPLPSFGSRGRPSPRDTSRGQTPGKTGGGKGGASGDGLTMLQRLDLAEQRAGLTAILSDDLKSARDKEAFYRKIAANKKLHGDKLFKAQQDLLNAQQRVQGIENQIAADRQQAQEKATEKRQAANEKLRKAEAAEDRRERARFQEQTARRQRELRRDSEVGDKRAIDTARARARTATNTAAGGVTQADISRQISDFLRDFQAVQNTLAGNTRPNVTVHQSFPAPTPDRNMEARYAGFAFRAAFDG
jgi:hypothetical protein